MEKAKEIVDNCPVSMGELLRLYKKLGSISAVSRALGFNRNTVTRWYRKRGLGCGKHGPGRYGRKYSYTSPARVETPILMDKDEKARVERNRVVAEGWSKRWVAERFGRAKKCQE